MPAPGSPEPDRLYRTLAAPDGLTAKRATFDARAVIEAICDELPHGGRVDQILELAAGFLASEHVLVIDGPDKSVSLRRTDGRLVPSAAGLCRYTTPEMVATEQHLLERAATRRHERTGIARHETVEAALAARSSSSDEQAAMVRNICGAGAGVDIIEGVAGAGKTFALAAAAEAWTASGFTVSGCSLAAKAAGRLQDASGIPSSSIDRLMGSLDRGICVLSSADVLIVDEAAMVGTRKLLRVLDHAERAAAKVVLIGDPRQLPEIDAGGAFTALARTLGASELVDNRRQIEQWERAVLAQLRAGNVDRVLDTYRAHGRVHDTGDVRQQLAADWYAARVQGHDAVMLAATTADVDDLNRRARLLLASRGRIGPAHLIDGRGFSVGDEVMALRNDYRLDLLNGTRMQIAAIDLERQQLVCRDERARGVAVPFAYVQAGHLTHAYATTVHKAQGATVEQSFVLADPGLTVEHAYTALSRASERTDLYIDTQPRLDPESHGPAIRRPAPPDRLAASLRRSVAQQLAIDQSSPQRVPIAALRAERDQLRQSLGVAPPDHTRRLADLEQRIRSTRDAYHQAIWRRDQAQQALEELGPLARRVHRAQRNDLEQCHGKACRDVEILGVELGAQTSEHRAIRREQRTLQKWEAIHAPELGRLAELDRVIRLAKTVEPKAPRARAVDRGMSLGL